MELRQLNYFLTICMEGSFSRAATRLHMTQPPLSMTVAALEREFGVKLLERTQRGVVPTEAGEYLVAEGSRLIEQTERIASHLRGLGSGVEGHLSVAAVPLFVSEFISGILRQFTEEAPNADFTLTDPNADGVVEAVLSGSANLGIVATTDARRFAEWNHRELSVLHIGDLPIKVALPPHYHSHPDPIDAMELKDELWFIATTTLRFPGMRDQITDLWAEVGHPMPATRAVSSLQTALPLIAGGLGVSLTHAPSDSLLYEHIVTRTLTPTVPPIQVAVIWRKDLELSPLGRHFVDVAIKSLAARSAATSPPE